MTEPAKCTECHGPVPPKKRPGGAPRKVCSLECYRARGRRMAKHNRCDVEMPEFAP